MESKIEKIRQFIVENFLYSKSADLSEDVSFLEMGIVDSTGILELITFIEAECGINVADEELLPENFDSISNIRGFLSRKVMATGACTNAA